MHARTFGFVITALAGAAALTLAAIAGCENPAPKSALVRPAGEPGVGQQAVRHR